MKLFFLSLLACTSLCAWAQAPVFQFACLDINTGSGDSNPEAFCVLNNKLLFIANDGIHGKEMWITDGTQAGTHILKAITPGSSTGYLAGGYAMGNVAYLSVQTAAQGKEMWVTDGTDAGTKLFKDILPGPGSSNASRYYNFNGRLFFGADDGVHGYELWTSDGTVNGTVMLKDVFPGGSGGPGDFTPCNGKLMLTAADAQHDRVLWITDGTENGTSMVKAVNSGAVFGHISNLVPFISKNKVFFTADDGVHGQEPWISDGTPAGTFMLRDIAPSSLSGSVSLNGKGMEYHGKMYFTANNDTNGAELWVTDGTTEGTHILQDLNKNAFNSYTAPFICFDNLLYLTANDYSNKYAIELYSTDGSAQGIKIVKDINPSPYQNSSFRVPAIYNARLYFAATEAPPINAADFQLYYCDGTASGTYQIKPPGASNASPLGMTTEMIACNGALYYPASYDGRGMELWRLEDTVLHPDNVAAVKMQDKPFMLYPNPAKNNCTLIPGSYTGGKVQVYDMNGRLMYQASFSGSYHTIPLQSISKGLYTVTLIQDGNAVSQRLVVE